ncbi:hypothetical protein DFS34DRAFT_617070 [Phlyctochytrium arcticum]|nr:hypothetical protein DFS34DRAFT_617070 [Phlyctochytrium arcticum]
MFGCIAAGRLVQTNMQQVDATKYVFELDDPASINHIVVFMTGVQPFPPGYAATVHFLWPRPDVPPQWQLLGMLSNEKPSAIFKLGGSKSSVASLFTHTSSSDSMDSMSSTPATLITPAVAAGIPAQLGISVEPIEVVMAQVAQLGTGTANGAAKPTGALTKISDPGVIAQKLLESLYNHCSSFAGNLPPGATALFGMDWNSTFIPLKAVQDWFNSMQRKLKNDPTGACLFRGTD